ncbi:MAG TPA: hypothetical protein VGM74_03865 [Burkholderiaceae bacterium]|jgi:hypothetical protein
MPIRKAKSKPASTRPTPSASTKTAATAGDMGAEDESPTDARRSRGKNAPAAPVRKR